MYKKSFPVIDLFFEQISFDQSNLDKLKNWVEENYSGQILKSALSYTNLKLLEYEFKHNTQSIPNRVSDLAKYIKVSEELLLSLLRQKGIKKKKDSILDESEFLNIKDFVLNKLNIIDREDKKKKIRNYTVRKKSRIFDKESSAINVYDKLQTYGMSKLIYIRKS